MKRLLVLLLAALACVLAAAQGLQPVPELTARVIDRTGTLDDIQRQGLEQHLAAFERERGTQIAILLVPTTQPEDIVGYANRVANAWKIGRKDLGDGVLVVVAKDDRRVRIEVAKTLEGAIPDLAARQIIETAITPAFRQGDYAGGLRSAADQLMARIKGEALPVPAQPGVGAGTASPGFDWFDTAIFLFFAVPIVGGILRGVLGRKLGSVVTGGGVGVLALLLTSSIVVAAIAAAAGLLFSLLGGGGFGGPRSRGGWGGAPIVFPGGGGWGGGGGGWGGGGGGFGSGGGGDFGGGGASGDW